MNTINSRSKFNEIKSFRKILFSICISSILLIVIYNFSGFYYGWIDDIWFHNYFRGDVSSESVINTLQSHRHLSSLIAFFYKYYPMIPWYGIIHYFLLFISIFIYNYFIINNKMNVLLLFVINLILFGGILNTFTSLDVSILLGSSFLLLYYLSRIKILYRGTLVCIGLFIALSIRIESFYVFVLVSFAYCLVSYVYRQELKKKIVKEFLLLIIILFSTFYGVSKTGYKNNELRENVLGYGRKTISYFDYGYLKNVKLETTKDSICFCSLNSLNFSIKNYCDSTVEKKMIYSNIFDAISNASISDRCNRFINSSEKIKGSYFDFRNVNIHFWLVFITVIAISLLNLKNHRVLYVILALSIVGFIFTFLLIATKIEFYLYRGLVFALLAPIFIYIKNTKKVFYGYIIILLPLFLFEVKRLEKSKEFNITLINNNIDFIKSIDKFDDKIIFLDLLTSSKLIISPFKEIDFRNFQFTSFPEQPLIYVKMPIDRFYINELSEEDALEKLYKYSILNKDDLVFIYVKDVHNKMYEFFYKKILDKNISFEQVESYSENLLIISDDKFDISSYRIDCKVSSNLSLPPQFLIKR